MGDKSLKGLKFSSQPNTRYRFEDLEARDNVTSLSGNLMSVVDQPFSQLTNNTIQKNKHYNVTLNSNITLNVQQGLVGKTGNADLFINPGSYTITGGSNLTIVSQIQPNKVNYCAVVWYGIHARLYVIEAFTQN